MTCAAVMSARGWAGWAGAGGVTGEPTDEVAHACGRQESPANPLLSPSQAACRTRQAAGRGDHAVEAQGHQHKGGKVARGGGRVPAEGGGRQGGGVRQRRQGARQVRAARRDAACPCAPLRPVQGRRGASACRLTSRVAGGCSAPPRGRAPRPPAPLRQQRCCPPGPRPRPPPHAAAAARRPGSAAAWQQPSGRGACSCSSKQREVCMGQGQPAGVRQACQTEPPAQLCPSVRSHTHLSGQPGTLHQPWLFSGVLRSGTTSKSAAKLPPLAALSSALPLPLPPPPPLLLGCCRETRLSCRGPQRLRSGKAAAAAAASTAAGASAGGAGTWACWAGAPAALLPSHVSELSSGSSWPAAPPASPPSAWALCGSAAEQAGSVARARCRLHQPHNPLPGAASCGVPQCCHAAPPPTCCSCRSRAAAMSVRRYPSSTCCSCACSRAPHVGDSAAPPSPGPATVTRT